MSSVRVGERSPIGMKHSFTATSVSPNTYLSHLSLGHQEHENVIRSASFDQRKLARLAPQRRACVLRVTARSPFIEISESRQTSDALCS